MFTTEAATGTWGKWVLNSGWSHFGWKFIGLHGSQLIPWHLQAGMCRTEQSKDKQPHNSVLEKGRPSTGAVTAALTILKVLAYSAINSQGASAPQFIQKLKGADPRVQGLCMQTRVVLLWESSRMVLLIFCIVWQIFSKTLECLKSFHAWRKA